LATIKRLNPQLLITDMEMPIMDGVSFLKVIEKDFPLLKVIVISGYDDFVYMKQAIVSKVFEYLLKPIDSVELNLVLKKCVQEIYNEQQTIAYASQLKSSAEEIFSHYRKSFQYGLMAKDLNQIRPSIQQMIDGLKTLEIDEEKKAKYLHDEITIIIREGWRELFQIDSFIEDYQELLRRVYRGISLDEYQKELIEIIKEAIAYYQKSIQESDSSVVELAKRYIDEHYLEELSLNQVAERLYTSKVYLSNAYKSKYQITIGNYILQLKMNEAVKLLKEGHKQTLIAERLGYQDATYFYKVFKKYYGCTPKDYKEYND
jgi:two-component system, response regulator YesN